MCDPTNKTYLWRIGNENSVQVVSKRIRSYRIWKTINEIEKDILNGLNKELFQNAREDLQKLFIGYIFVKQWMNFNIFCGKIKKVCLQPIRDFPS